MSLKLTSDNFDATIADGVTMVDFFAEWCGPCKMIAPIIEELAEEFDGKAIVAKVDTEAQADLAVKHGIRSIPAILFFKDGVKVDEIIGASSKEIFANKINSLL